MKENGRENKFVKCQQQSQNACYEEEIEIQKERKKDIVSMEYVKKFEEILTRGVSCSSLRVF